jgi:hypothetical protein
MAAKQDSWPGLLGWTRRSLRLRKGGCLPHVTVNTRIRVSLTHVVIENKTREQIVQRERETQKRATGEHRSVAIEGANRFLASIRQPVTLFTTR